MVVLETDGSVSVLEDSGAQPARPSTVDVVAARRNESLWD